MIARASILERTARTPLSIVAGWRSEKARQPARPAALAARRAFWLSAVVGGLALACVIFVITQLLESWRLASPAQSPEISIFGQRVSYPAANVGAIVVTVLA